MQLLREPDTEVLYKVTAPYGPNKQDVNASL